MNVEQKPKLCYRTLVCKHMARTAIMAAIASVMVLTLGWSTAASAHASSKAKSARCEPRHSHLVVADGVSQVYESLDSTGHWQFIGCVLGSRHRYMFGAGAEECSRSGCTGTEHIVLAGSVRSIRDTRRRHRRLQRSWQRSLARFGARPSYRPRRTRSPYRR